MAKTKFKKEDDVSKKPSFILYDFTKSYYSYLDDNAIVNLLTIIVFEKTTREVYASSNIIVSK
jgi:hypothetical protein